MYLGKTFGKLEQKVLLDIAISLAKDGLPKLAFRAALSVIDNIKRKISEEGAIRAGKRSCLVYLNEVMDDITRIIESLENPGLIDGATMIESKKYKNKNVDFLGMS